MNYNLIVSIIVFVAGCIIISSNNTTPTFKFPFNSRTETKHNSLIYNEHKRVFHINDFMNDKHDDCVCVPNLRFGLSFVRDENKPLCVSSCLMKYMM